MCGARGQPHPSRAEQISVSAWRRIGADILGTHEEPRLAVESGALLGVTHPLQERSLKKRYPQRVSRFIKSAFGWRLGSSRSGYALQRRQAVVSQHGETSTLARWNLPARIISRSVAPLPWNLRWPFNRALADRRSGPKEHTAKKSYSHMTAASRMSRSHNLGTRYSDSQICTIPCVRYARPKLVPISGLTHAVA